MFCCHLRWIRRVVHIGGAFTKVGNADHVNIAHILANGTVDSAWNAGANAPVRAIALHAPPYIWEGNLPK